MSNGTVIYLNDVSGSFVAQYSNATQNFIANEWAPTGINIDTGNNLIGIEATAQILGVSATAIAGIMAKENDTYWQGPTTEWAKDHFLVLRSGNGHNGYDSSQAYWVAQYNQVQNIITPSSAQKLTNPILIDLGKANFQLFTAIRLLQEYQKKAEYSSDPLGLSGYFSDYNKLAQDLVGNIDHLAARFYGLIIKEAQKYFIDNCPTYWAGLPTEYQDALCTTYAALGKLKIEQLRGTPPPSNYEPQPGYGDAAGISHLANTRLLGQWLGVTGYGDGVYGISSSQLSTIADSSSPEGMAARYALCHLKITVGVTDSVIQNDAALAVYDPAVVSGAFFTDRANFLQAKLLNLIQNNTIKSNAAVSNPSSPDNWQYTDLSSNYKLFTIGTGSASHEVIFGADGKTLQGRGFDDHLFAGTGTETLKGGGGKDAYYILANQTGVKDTITDVGGKGSIWVGNTQLKEELTRVSGKDNTWTDASQTQYTFDPVTNQLTITGGQLVGDGEKIIINDFNLNQAQTNADGYLGLHIKEVVKLKKGTEHLTNAQVFNQAGGPVDPPPGVYAYTAYVSAISDKPQTVTLGLSGADPAGFAVDTGNGIIQFVNGQITLAIPAGRDSVTFGLINTTDVPTPETIQLTETLNGNTAVTDTLAVTYTASPAANTTQANYTIAGGYAPREFKTEIPAGTTTIDPTWLNPTYAVGSTHTDPDTGLVTVLSYIVSYNLKDAVGNLIPDMGKPTPNKNASLLGSSGNDQISTIANATYLDARQGGNDTISGDQNNDYILAGDGNNIITGQGGKDVLTAGNGNNQIYANDKMDIVTALAQRQNAQSTNTQGDYIAVGNGNNTIVGGSGNDAILMGSGDNTVYCGPGSVTLMGGVSAQPPTFYTNAVDFGALPWSIDSNTTYPFWFNDTGVSITGTGPLYPSAGYVGWYQWNSMGGGNDTIYGGGGNGNYTLSNGNNWLDTGNGNNMVFAGAGNDTILAGNGNNTIWGGGGSNYITLGSGSNFVAGRGGNSIIVGSSGNDTIYAGFTQAELNDQRNPFFRLQAIRQVDAAANVYVQGGTGNSEIHGSAGNNTLISGSETGGSTTIYGGGEWWTNASATDYIVGGNGNDVLNAGWKNTTIYAGNGDTSITTGSNTTVYGGLGSDTIHGNGGYDVVINTGDGGTDAKATQAYADGNLRTTIYGGAGVDQLFGGTSSLCNDTLVAGTGTSTLTGGAGTEVMYSSIGNATLIAGTGSDTLYGGGGTDLLKGTSGTTLFVAGSGNETIMGGSGTNTYEFDAGFGNVELQNARSADTFNFGAGISPTDLTLSATIGGDGNAALLIQDASGGQIIIDGGIKGAISQFAFADGTSYNLDQLMSIASSTSATVAGASGDVKFSGTGGDTLTGGTGNDTLYAWNGGNTLAAGSGNQRLRSGTGHDTLFGGAGSDTLLSIAGNDLMIGGAGNTTFVVSSNTDIIQATSTGSNVNTVESSVSFVLPESVQNLTLTGADNLAAIGNNLGNVMIANDGNDTLMAGAGGGMLIGGSGNDLLIGSGSATTLVGGGGADTLAAGAGGGSLLAGSGNDVLVAGDGAATLVGGSGNSTMIGGAGATTMIGGSGFDTMIVGTGGGTIVAGTGWENIVLNQGIGRQTIIESATVASGMIQFGAGISSGNSQFFLNGADMLITFGTQGDSVLIKGFAPNGPTGVYTINQFQFADGSASYVNDGQGNASVITYGDTSKTAFWQKPDGSYGNDSYYYTGGFTLSSGTAHFADGASSTYYNDGQGGVTTKRFDASGNLQSASKLVGDGQGNDTTTTSDATGAVLCVSVSTNDGMGNTSVKNYNAAGKLLSDVFVYADGSHSTDTFNTDGTSSGTWYAADGSGYAYTQDASGNNYFEQDYGPGGVFTGTYSTTVDALGGSISAIFDSNGIKTFDNWDHINIDGTWGSDTFNVDGSSTGSTNRISPDGVFVGTAQYTNDGQGNVTTNNYDANGNLADYSIFAGDVLGNGTATNYDALGNVTGTSVSVNDGLGNSSTTSYDAGGIKLSDNWAMSDGTSGSDTFNADGSYTNVVNDGHGDVATTSHDAAGNVTGSSIMHYDGHSAYTTSTFDASGVKLGDTWFKTDGSHGSDAFNADGSSSGTAYSGYGTSCNYSTYANDVLGNVTTNFYDAGNTLLSHTELVSDGHGNGTATNYDAAGNVLDYSVSANDGLGNTSVENYSSSGFKLSDSWIRADGSNGTDTFSVFGSSSGTTHHADGSYSTYTDNGINTASTTNFDANGIKISDVRIRAADGTHGSDTFNADGSSSGITYNADGSYSTFANDGMGNGSTVSFDANGVKLADSWTKLDGSNGNDTFGENGAVSRTAYNADRSYSIYSNDGHGNSSTTNYDMLGNVLGSSVTMIDVLGNTTTSKYDASGILLSDTYTTSSGGHGSDTYNVYGVTSGSEYLADGSHYTYTQDAQGNYVEQDYNAAHVKVGSNYSRPDGSWGEDSYHADGSSSGSAHSADGSYTTYANDGHGNDTTTSFDATGVKLKDGWVKADGSHGTDTFNADGSSSGAAYAANGSHSAYTNDGLGDVMTTYFDAAGTELSATWAMANGSFGSDTFNADGSSTSYVNDGLGNATTTNFDANGNQLSDNWIKSDGSHGLDTFNPDGTSTGTAYAANGSYSTYANDGLGHIVTSYFDAAGHLLNNGSGTVTTPILDGAGNVIGSSVAVNDGLGNVTTTSYDLNNVKLSDTWTKADGTHGSDTFNADGSSTGTSYAANGSYSTYTNNGLGNVTTYNYDANGVELGYTTSTNDGLGNITTTHYNATNGEVTGSVATAGAGYSYTYDNTVNVGGVAGVTESKVNYTYADGSTYATDTVYDPNGSYQQSTAKGDGSTTTTNYNAANGEVTGSVATAGAGYSYTYDNTVNVGGVAGVTESKVNYTYADGSTYATDTVYDPNGSYQQSTAKGDGSTTTTNYNAANGEVTGSVATAGAGYSYTYDNTVNVGGVAGVTESKVAYTYADGSTYATDTVYDPNGSYQQSTAKGDGSTTTTNYNAANGEVTGSVATAGAGYSYTYDNTVNVGGVAGVTESKVAYTYADGSTYATDTVYDPNGSYQQSTAKGDGSTTTTNYNAANGEVTGSVATAGAGYSYTYDNTVNVGGVAGVTESKVAYTYADGSTYATDTVYDPNGSYQQSTAKGDGSTTTTDYNAANGEVTGSVATAGAGYSYTYDNTVNVGGVAGVTESKVNYTYADGSTYATDTVYNPDGSYFQAWNKSDGTAGSSAVNASGILTGDSWAHADGSQGVDAGGNHLIMSGAGSDAITAATGNDILIGGAGNDVITTGAGSDIIAFNKGDGQDVVNAVAGQNNVLSLGGNFAYNDLALAKNGNDLILNVGASDSITFQGWYTGNQNIVDLQVIASSLSDFNPGSSDILRNTNVENFDFQNLVAQFDAAQAATPGITTWGVTNALLAAHLSGSDTAALGGDLAYQYGAQGSLSGMNVAAAETTLTSNQFATAQQNLNPWPTLNTGTAQIK